MGTKDIKIQNRCDHKVIFERVRLATDRVTLSTVYPVGSHKYLELTRFGNVVPPSKYFFKRDRETLYGDKYFSIELKYPDMYNDAVYEVTYTAPAEFCPKCLGSQFVDDIAIDDFKEVSIVEGAYLLIQEVEKAIVTNKNTNPYYPWVGASLSSLIGSKITDFVALAQEIQTQVRNSLENLKSQQLKHQEINPLVSSDEVLDTIENVDVTQDEADPSIVYIYVQYTSQSGSPYDYSQVMDLTQYRPR